MSLYITLPIEDVGNDSVQAFLTIDTESPSVSAISRLSVEKYDALEWAYNPEERFMVPGIVTVEFKDLNHGLDSLLFGDEFVNSATQKVKLEIRVNSVTEFIGYATEDGIFSQYDQFLIKMTFAPELDIINKKMILDQENNPINPFAYTLTSYYKLTDVLTDLFQVVNPIVTYSSGRLKILHNWEFRGSIASSNQRDDIVLTDLFVLVGYLYNDPLNGMKTCGDVLKTLATEFGSFTGMIHQEKAFFKKLYTYESGNLQAVEVLTWSKGYRYGLLDYVKVTDAGTYVYEAGTFTEMEDRFIQRQGSLVFAWTDIPTIPYGNAGWNILGYKDSNYYDIRRVKDASIGSDWLNFGQLTANWWYYWRQKKSRTRVDKFLLNGLSYDFLKSFNYSGHKYQIISMKKYLSDGNTEVEAFYLGDL
jgi:hypothetical protein